MSPSAPGWFFAFVSIAAASWADAATSFGLPAPYETVSEQYIVIQNKLAADQFSGIPVAAQAMEAALDQQQDRGLGALHRAAAQLAAAKDLNSARAAFKEVSTDLVAQFKQDHLSTGYLHEVYCPAARGCWIQTDAKEAHNPYFGKERPNCGDLIGNF